MDTTTHTRRASGKGRGASGKRSAQGFSPREKRRLLQLAASIILFLAVFLGRDVLPGGREAWKKVLEGDIDLKAVTAFLEERMIALEREFFPQQEQVEETPPPESSTPVLSVQALPFGLHSSQPGFTPAQLLVEQPTVPSAEPTETEPPQEEVPAVVTAVAQVYDDSGAKLPDRVSLLAYELGLEETVVPVMGNVTSGFGFRDHPVSGEYTFHTAVDVGVDTGTEVLAFSDGTVRYIGENGVFGLYVKLDHDNGVSTFYAHCEKLLVSKGERVLCGQVIALSGETGNATGPHLHFSLEKDGIRLDPEHYLDF